MLADGPLHYDSMDQEWWLHPQLMMLLFGIRLGGAGCMFPRLRRGADGVRLAPSEFSSSLVMLFESRRVGHTAARIRLMAPQDDPIATR